MVVEIQKYDRKPVCVKCKRLAGYLIVFSEVKEIKICSNCASQMIEELCQFGFAQRAADKAIQANNLR